MGGGGMISIPDFQKIDSWCNASEGNQFLIFHLGIVLYKLPTHVVYP